MDGVRGNFAERLEHESSLVHEGMGDDQFLAADDLVAKKQKIDVDEARLPLFAASPAELRFDFQYAMEEGMRAERGFDFRGGVEKRGGIGASTDRGVFKQGRDAYYLNIFAARQMVEGGENMFLPIAEICAQSQICRCWGLVAHASNSNHFGFDKSFARLKSF